MTKAAPRRPVRIPVAGEGEGLAGWLHEPAGEGRDCVAVLCPPMGYEYVHGFRSLRRLAERLAEAGIACLRFDYHGTGDSPGSDLEPGRLERWRRDVRAATAYARSVSRRGQLALIGVRLGGLLAAEAAAENAPDFLVLWSPVASGRRYVREMRAAAAAGAPGPAEAPGLIDAGGFVLTAQTAEALAGFELASLRARAARRTLVLARAELEAERQLAARLGGDALAVDCVLYEGYAQMMAEPQYTEIPVQAIEAIVGWLVPKTAGAASSRGGAAYEPGLAEQRIAHDGAALTERPLRFGRLFGVLCEPVGTRPERPVVVMLNAGSVHHVGPNRLYVELARALGAAGVTSLRMDLSGLGESAVAGEPRENHPYPVSAVADTEAALRALRERLPGARRFVLLGLCSGAHTAFHAAVAAGAEVELAGTLLINPLTFHWVEGMSLDSPTTRHYQEVAYYRRGLRDPAKWLKLLRGEVKLGAAARVVTEQARRFARGWLSRNEPSRLASDLETLFARGRDLSLFVARQDPGYDLLVAGAGRRVRRDLRERRIRVRFIENADHTFSRLGPRRELVRSVCERILELG